jgi:hypothetical protein
MLEDYLIKLLRPDSEDCIDRLMADLLYIMKAKRRLRETLLARQPPNLEVAIASTERIYEAERVRLFNEICEALVERSGHTRQ